MVHDLGSMDEELKLVEKLNNDYKVAYETIIGVINCKEKNTLCRCIGGELEKY